MPALLRRAITVCEQDRKDDGARVVGRYPSVNETARMTVRAVLDGGSRRAARGRYPSVNETARMTVPALLDGGSRRAA